MGHIHVRQQAEDRKVAKLSDDGGMICRQIPLVYAPQSRHVVFQSQDSQSVTTCTVELRSISRGVNPRQDPKWVVGICGSARPVSSLLQVLVVVVFS